MELVRKYCDKHRQHMLEVFHSMGKGDKIEATKVFNYMQESFDQQQMRFEMNGRNFFQDFDNATEMEKLMESYYRITQNDESKKFYLYRIQFTFQEIIDILQFWLSREPSVKVIYNSQKGPQNNRQQATKVVRKNSIQPNQQQQFQGEQENNQFDVDEENLPNLIEECQKKIKDNEDQLKVTENEQERESLNKGINDLKMKIKVLEQRMKTNQLQKPKNTPKKAPVEPMEDSVRTESPSNSATLRKVTINYKAIFEFYAKQTHLTGVKATFQRIQHESQSINYQKLVHFLRQFNLLPSDVPSRKKVHGLYIRNCQPTRDLNLEGFLNVLDGVAGILYPQKNKEERSEVLKAKIYEKSKNNKILNHPFHSLEKEDFRINVNELNYNFKLKPQDGKFVHEVNNSIEKRKQDKLEAKTQRSKQKELKEIRYLKKLQAIDPFNALVLKNNKKLEQKSQPCEPIASLQNMEKYRDHSFNFENHFGIDLGSEVQSTNNVEKLPRRNSELKREYSQRYKKGQETQKKVEKLQKDQAFKMENLMSGIIQRSNAKMSKMGISPSKLQKSVRFT